MIHVPTAPWAHPLFDGLAWIGGSFTGVSLYRWRLREAVRGVARKVGAGYFLALGGGAVLAAWASGTLNTIRDPVPHLSHSVLGALVGAVLGVEIYKAWRGIKGSTGTLFVGSFAVGVAIGRWGCFFTGLPDETFGTPTALPWGVDLGDGIARHPVQLYESLAMAGFFGLYLFGLARRADWALRRAFYLMCLWYGGQRFLWEFFKPYPKVLGPLNIFQVLCLALMAYAFIYDQRAADPDLPRQRALPLPGADDEPLRDVPRPGAGQDHL